MYMSRVELDNKRLATKKALTSLNLMHGAVEAAFEGERKRTLWRIDSQKDKIYLYLVSEDAPQLDVIQKQFGPDCVTDPPKEYDRFLDRIIGGDRWQFRLCANPVKSQLIEGQRGKVIALAGTESQKEWLCKAASKNGFVLESFDVVQTEWKRFSKGSARRLVTIHMVTFAGILRVTDVAAFRKALTEGIGREKAYGCGLLTIARV
jgi:CRISPR system Cascade subunit CasE